MLTTEQIAELQALDKPHLAEVLAVYWEGETEDPTYYGITAWNELPSNRD
jgi:hypothetical protein